MEVAAQEEQRRAEEEQEALPVLQEGGTGVSSAATKTYNTSTVSNTTTVSNTQASGAADSIVSDSQVTPVLSMGVVNSILPPRLGVVLVSLQGEISPSILWASGHLPLGFRVSSPG